jgi:hypothetical protein
MTPSSPGSGFFTVYRWKLFAHLLPGFRKGLRALGGNARLMKGEFAGARKFPEGSPKRKR